RSRGSSQNPRNMFLHREDRWAGRQSKEKGAPSGAPLVNRCGSDRLALFRARGVEAEENANEVVAGFHAEIARVEGPAELGPVRAAVGRVFENVVRVVSGQAQRER